MTTKELRDALDELIAEHPDAADLHVRTEGCDCDGDVLLAKYVPATSGTYHNGQPWERVGDVYLIRSDGGEHYQR